MKYVLKLLLIYFIFMFCYYFVIECVLFLISDVFLFKFFFALNYIMKYFFYCYNHSIYY